MSKFCSNSWTSTIFNYLSSGLQLRSIMSPPGALQQTKLKTKKKSQIQLISSLFYPNGEDNDKNMQSINVSHHVRCTTNAPLESTSTHTQHNTEYTLQSNEHIVLVNNNNNKRMQTAEWNTSWHKATQRRMPIRRTLTDTRNKLFHRQKCRHIFFFCGYLFFSAFTYNNWTNKQVCGAPVNERWKKILQKYVCVL